MRVAGWLRPAVVALLISALPFPGGLAAGGDGSADARAAAAYEALGDFLAADTSPGALDRAIGNYEKAAAAGSASARIKLASLLAGRPGEADVRQAAALLREAIALGAAGPAGDALGDLHRDDFRLRDLGLALAAYAEAAAAGHPGTVDKIAAILASGAASPADRERAIAGLERAAAGDNPAPAALQLGRLYSAGASHADIAKARRYYAIAAAGGIGEAHLALAEMAADRFQDPRARREAVDHFLAAAATLGVETVAVRMEALPQPVLLAIVGDLVVQRGFGVVPLAGGTADIVAGFCRNQTLYYCSERVIPWEMLVDLIGGRADP